MTILMYINAYTVFFDTDIFNVYFCILTSAKKYIPAQAKRPYLSVKK